MILGRMDTWIKINWLLLPQKPPKGTHVPQMTREYNMYLNNMPMKKKTFLILVNFVNSS